ncbi:PLP-dependent decarboxylase [bacterium]|nr:PLP-dependent decarboxylase [bacterium]
MSDESGGRAQPPRTWEVEAFTVFKRLFKIIEQYRLQTRPGKYIAFQEPEALKALLDLDRKEGLYDWDLIFSWVEQYLQYNVVTHHPRFLNRMWSGANLPSLVGEIIAAVSNTSAGTFESAPVSTLMETAMIQQMLELVGYPKGEGQMTTGSSNANLIAMLAARNQISDSIKHEGIFSEKELFAFVSQDAHYSLDKAANIVGIGSRHLVKIPVDERGRMDLQLLETNIQAVRQSAGVPFFVCATAGTTVRGAYDPIETLLDLRDRYGFWLHVDGAWGGAAIFNPELRSRFLTGIERVDSFTWDFHKMAGTALMCNILLFKDGDILRTTARVGDTSYIFGATRETDDLNPGSFSLQCGRRVDSLKWFLDWKYYGRQGLAERVAAYHQLCEYAEHLVLQSADLEMVVPRESFNVCFRFVVPDTVSSNGFNRKLRDELHRREIGLIGSGYIGADFCLRLLIANPRIDEPEIAAFFQALISEGNRLLEQP